MSGASAGKGAGLKVSKTGPIKIKGSTAQDISDAGASIVATATTVKASIDVAMPSTVTFNSDKDNTKEQMSKEWYDRVYKCRLCV